MILGQRLVFPFAAVFTVALLAGSVSCADSKGSSANATASSTVATPSSTVAPTLAIKAAPPVANGTVLVVKVTNSTAPTSKSEPVGNAKEDDCADDEPVPEPEGKKDDRQAKKLDLGNEKDKYTHENGTAEPEPENSSQSGTKDALNGNSSTTPAPAAGSSGSAIQVSMCHAILGISLIQLKKFIEN